MAYIKLNGSHSEGKKAIIDENDISVVGQYKWYLTPGGYATAYEKIAFRKYTTIYLHRLIMHPTPKDVVDHINGNKLDCRRMNMRLCTRGQNSTYSRIGRNNTTGFKGVTITKSGKYLAAIYVKRKCITLGRFDNITEAAKAYDVAAINYFGAYAHTNGILLN